LTFLIKTHYMKIEFILISNWYRILKSTSEYMLKKMIGASPVRHSFI